ncbi:MAG: transposase [Methanoregulaceae archaeon]|nr:transposase [Methanoregulaceae archaeon]
MLPGRPRRLARERYVGEWSIAFTVNVFDRQKIFVDDQIVAAHVEMLGKATREFGCVAPIYCFLPDHAHILLMGVSENSDLLAAIVKYKSVSGYWMHQRKLPRWQPSFYDHVLRVEEDWRNQVWYIAQNPIRAGLAQNWSEYPYTGSIGCDLHEIVAGYA